MTIENEYVVAGTGPRHLETAGSDARRRASLVVERHIGKLLDAHGPNLSIMSGMAEGFDHLVACTALRIGAHLWCAIPSRGYADHYWRRNSVTGRDRLAEFCRIRDMADRVTYVMEEVHGTRGLYLRGLHANFVRNLWMVDCARELMTLDPTSRGTAHCVSAAALARKPCVDLTPQVDLIGGPA